MAKKFRTRARDAPKINRAVLIVVGLFAYFMFAGFPGSQQAETQPTTPTESGSLGGCNVEDISFNAKLTRLGKAGTALGNNEENYYIITDSLGHTSGASSATVPTNYDMQIMFGENSTSYYTVVKSINTGCTDPKYEAVKLAYTDTSLNSFYAKNSDGSVNALSNNESVAADDEFETTVTIKAGSDSYFGNPNSDCQNIAVVEYDKTYIKKVEGDSPVAVPGMFTYSSSGYDGSNAFYIPKSADGQEVSFNVKLESTSSDPDGTNVPILHVYDCDIDKNEDTLQIIEGVEDEDLNMISLANQTLSIYIN